MNNEDLHHKFLECSGVSTDTRKIEPNNMYFALKGDNFDGNAFAKQALEAGATYAVVDDASIVLDKERYILVDDVLQRLQELANHHRHSLNIPIIALTGSNGKTTTKELIHAVLSTTYTVGATKGNLNNHIGVPLTLLSFDSNLDYGIVEMGANHQKEIEFLCSIAVPNFGVITNFGKAHMEGFGGIEGIIKGKSELYDYLKSHNGLAFINSEDPKQMEQLGSYGNRYTFGPKGADTQVAFSHANPFVTGTYNQTEFSSQLIGGYNFTNIAIAISIGEYFDVPESSIIKGIESYTPTNNRSQIMDKGSNHIILDAYNANPTSMKAALHNLFQLEASHKVVFLGDMFELGDYAKEEHQAIVNLLESEFDGTIFLAGENFYDTERQGNTKAFKTFEDLKNEINDIEFENATILIKGSRGMALERVLDFI
ncbi:UDP-N-acetylmuramoyl-tripeptide--D-alanyl-D-alanine ligase [Winogradskyella maritima]|uniref:UDP-N-acetylmuramoyl-tripeptide--D-alanyl-D-alanine ligase n=1 Tax=Winogradskyella maritima TaxID=1517766 RepID=A0ABV8AP50_9FLAO|nr:UDP-N-acetylmuramoyl-tripeptide--D-alanyl-D-alanine ligase [Winogradskyella maritima]